jgi:hypothetical protein
VDDESAMGVGGDFGFYGISKCLSIDPGRVRENRRWLSGCETTGHGAMATGILAGMRESSGESPLSHPFRMNSSFALPGWSLNFTIKNYSTRLAETRLRSNVGQDGLTSAAGLSPLLSG